MLSLGTGIALTRRIAHQLTANSAGGTLELSGDGADAVVLLAQAGQGYAVLRLQLAVVLG